MLTRTEYQRAHPDLHEGMTAYTRDGEKLGRVVELDEDSLTVQKGVFFPKDFTFRYDDITDEHGDEIIVARDRPDLMDWKSESYAGWNEYERRNLEEGAGHEARHREEGSKIRLHEEQLDIQKVERQKGEVHVRKVVHTEIRNIEVPLTREEVVVERKPAEGRDLEPGEKAFKEEEIRIPVKEEEVEVKKRPVVKEEVDIHKEKHTERREVSEEVRSEDVEIDDEGDVERKG